jgi:glutathione-regulated potassium-efflux system protein KefB
MELAPLDLRSTVREVFESAVAMGREALALFCVDSEEVDRVDREYRERDRQRLDSQTASGDLHAMKETMFRPDNPLGESEGPG